MRCLIGIVLSWGMMIGGIQAQELSGVEMQQTLNALGAPPSPTSNNVVRTFDNRFKGVRGTPFLLPDWTSGKIIEDVDDTVKNVKLHYDVVEQDLWVENNMGYRLIINKDKIKGFIISDESSDRIFITHADPDNSDKSTIFMEVLEKGVATLLCKRRKYYVPADRTSSAYNHHPYDEYREGKTAYYLSLAGDSTLHKIAPRKGKILKTLGEHTQELKQYIKDQAYYIIEEPQIEAIVRHYNLLSQ